MRGARIQGMTLLEVLIASSLFSIVILQMMGYCLRSYVVVRQQAESTREIMVEEFSYRKQRVHIS